MRFLVCGAVLVASVSASVSEPVLFKNFGAAGRADCASWLASPASEAEGSAWILGFWTGNNYATGSEEKGGDVGSGLKDDDIIGLMKKLCATDTDMSLLTAAALLYGEARYARK